MPLISVIVPVYNAENTLKYCINSILNQTFGDFELLLVDDGSKDKSAEICDAFAEKDNRITVIHKENGGVSSARNEGIKKASGKYICFVDSDDSVVPEYLNELCKPMLDGFSFAICGFNYVDSKGIEQPTVFDGSDSYTTIGKNTLYKLTSPPFISQPWNKIFKKSILDKYNITMPENLSLGEDMVFNFHYIDKIIDEKFFIINKPLYNYYTGSAASLLNKYRSDLLEINTVLNKTILEYIENWNLNNVSETSFKDDAFIRLENVLFNTFNKNNKDSFMRKLSYNRRVIKSNNFKSLYKAYTGKRNIVFKFSYMVKSFLPVYLMCKFKNGI